MKKVSFYLLLLTIVFVGFTSCGSDDNKVYANQKFVGTWHLQSVKIVADVSDAKYKNQVTEAILKYYKAGDLIHFTKEGFYDETRVERFAQLEEENDEISATAFTFSVKGNKLKVVPQPTTSIAGYEAIFNMTHAEKKMEIMPYLHQRFLLSLSPIFQVGRYRPRQSIGFESNVHSYIHQGFAYAGRRIVVSEE